MSTESDASDETAELNGMTGHPVNDLVARLLAEGGDLTSEAAKTLSEVFVALFLMTYAHSEESLILPRETRNERRKVAQEHAEKMIGLDRPVPASGSTVDDDHG